MELTKNEQEYLINLLLKEIETNEQYKKKFAGHLKDSFFELDKFIHNLYKKVCEEKND